MWGVALTSLCSLTQRRSSVLLFLIHCTLYMCICVCKNVCMCVGVCVQQAGQYRGGGYPVTAWGKQYYRNVSYSTLISYACMCTIKECLRGRGGVCMCVFFQVCVCIRVACVFADVCFLSVVEVNWHSRHNWLSSELVWTLILVMRDTVHPATAAEGVCASVGRCMSRTKSCNCVKKDKHLPCTSCQENLWPVV